MPNVLALCQFEGGPRVKPMIAISDQSAIERAKTWVENNVIGCSYYYETWDDPLDDTTVRTWATCCPKSDEDPDSWVTIHKVSIIECQIEEKDSDSVVVRVEAVLFKSDSDEDNEGEGETYEEDMVYHLNVWDDAIELLAVD